MKVEALTDSKGLWENLNNTRQCDEKLLRNSISLMKEMMEKGEVKTIDRVETSKMLADIMTKQGGNGAWIKKRCIEILFKSRKLFNYSCW